jgi:hypothetical protein
LGAAFSSGRLFHLRVILEASWRALSGTRHRAVRERRSEASIFRRGLAEFGSAGRDHRAAFDSRGASAPHTSVALADLIKLSGGLVRIEARTGRKAPSVVT